MSILGTHSLPQILATSVLLLAAVPLLAGKLDDARGTPWDNAKVSYYDLIKQADAHNHVDAKKSATELHEQLNILAELLDESVILGPLHERDRSVLKEHLDTLRKDLDRCRVFTGTTESEIGNKDYGRSLSELKGYWDKFGDEFNAFYRAAVEHGRALNALQRETGQHGKALNQDSVEITDRLNKFQNVCGSCR